MSVAPELIGLLLASFTVVSVVVLLRTGPDRRATDVRPVHRALPLDTELELESTPVAHVTRTTCFVEPSCTLREFVERCPVERPGVLVPVVDRCEVIGFVGLDDAASVPAAAWEGYTVDDVMTPWLRSRPLGIDASVADALDACADQHVAQVAVSEQGRIVGLARLRDIEGWMQLRKTPDPPPV